MIIEFLKKLRSECLDEKLDLESEQNRLKIKWDQNIIFIQKLKEEDEQNYDAFSPRKQNLNLKDNIRSLEEENYTLLQKLENINKHLEILDKRLNEFDQVLNIAKENDAELKSNKNSSFEEKNAEVESDDISMLNISDLIHKLEFCYKLFDLDLVRCKLELSILIKKIYEIFGKEENVGVLSVDDEEDDV